MTDETMIEANRTRRYLKRLDTLQKRLDSQAAIIRNGSGNPDAESQAGRLLDEAFAVRWAVGQLDPAAARERYEQTMTEAVTGQVAAE